MSRKVVRSSPIDVLSVMSAACLGICSMYGQGALRIRDIFVPSNHHTGEAFESWTGSSPLARFPLHPDQVQVSPSGPSPTTHPSPKQTCSTSPQKGSAVINPRILGAREGGMGEGGAQLEGVVYLLCSVALSHFPGSPDGFLYWPQGEGAQARRRPRGGGLQPHQNPSAFGT